MLKKIAIQSIALSGLRTTDPRTLDKEKLAARGRFRPVENRAYGLVDALRA